MWRSRDYICGPRAFGGGGRGEQLGLRGLCYHYGGRVDNPPFGRNRIKLLLTSIDRSDLAELEASGGLGNYHFADGDETLLIRSHDVH